MPAGGFERPTARSSAECSPRLSYAGTKNLPCVEELKVVFIIITWQKYVKLRTNTESNKVIKKSKTKLNNINKS